MSAQGYDFCFYIIALQVSAGGQNHQEVLSKGASEQEGWETAEEHVTWGQETQAGARPCHSHTVQLRGTDNFSARHVRAKPPS